MLSARIVSLSGLLATIVLGVWASTALAQERQVPPLVNLDGHFPFNPPASRQAWIDRREALKLRLRIATGLHPMLPRPPIRATIHSPAVREGFRVESVYFESLPGHFVTGSLFRPTGTSKDPRPAVLCPHGHGGRLQRYDDGQIADLIASGDERYVQSGRMPKIARCAQLARMGCVVFLFDMVGYGDSRQLSHGLAHFKTRVRKGEVVAGGESPDRFDGTPAVARLQSIMGLQTFNALRSLDFLAGLPDVDAQRIAVTGGSGGGTQTILLGALDDRVAVSFPNGMVSTSMQGGCTCENACYLRIGTGNVELAGLLAPKPMGMTAADDWTRDMMTDGYPQLRQLYSLFGKTDNVDCQSLLRFKHNYNYVTRATMYEFMNRHLDLGLSSPIIEADYAELTPQELSVWNGQHPPRGLTGQPHEAELLSWWNRHQRDVLSRPNAFADLIRPALQTIYDLPVPDHADVVLRIDAPALRGDLKRVAATLRYAGSEFDVAILSPAERDSVKDVDASQAGVLVWVTDQLPTADTILGELRSKVRSGWTVMAIGLGSFEGRQPMNNNPRRTSVVYTYGYNRPLAVRRCGAVLAAVVAARQFNRGPIELRGAAGSAASVLPAVAIAGDRIRKATVDVAGFRFGDLRHQDDVNFVPGMVKYGDVESLIRWCGKRLEVTRLEVTQLESTQLDSTPPDRSSVPRL